MRTSAQEQAFYRGYSPRKVAARLGCSVPQVLALIDEGSLRAIDVSRRDTKHPRWSVLPEDLGRFENERANRPAA